MIDAAIVGVGRWGRTLVDAVQGKSDRIRFTAGYTRSPEKARDYCAEKGIALYGDYAALLRDSGVDAVVIASPHTAHERQILDAVAAGKHVFCEKPMTLTRASARACAEACAANGLVLGIGHNRRLQPNAIALKRMIEAGELGTLMHVEGNFSASLTVFQDTWRHSREESPAGGMTSMGIHVIDMMIHLCGRVRDVTTRSIRRAIDYDIDDTTASLMTFDNGMLGYLGSLAQTGVLWHVRVFGSKGWAELCGLDTVVKCMVGGAEEVTAYDPVDSRAAGLESFADAIDGKAPFFATPDEIVHGVSVLEAIIASAEKGTRITIA